MKFKKALELDSSASEASHLYRKVRTLPASEARKPPAGLASRSGAAGAKTGLRVVCMMRFSFNLIIMYMKCMLNGWIGK